MIFVYISVATQSDQSHSFPSEEPMDPWIPYGAPIEDSDQTAQMVRLFWVFDRRTCQLVPFAGHLGPKLLCILKVKDDLL